MSCAALQFSNYYLIQGSLAVHSSIVLPLEDFLSDVLNLRCGSFLLPTDGGPDAIYVSLLTLVT